MKFSRKSIGSFLNLVEIDTDPAPDPPNDVDPTESGPTTLHVRLGYADLDLGVEISVADPDPGSGTFLTPGSGIRNRFFPDPGSRIPDPKPIFLRAY